jgi:hypothetical protein
MADADQDRRGAFGNEGLVAYGFGHLGLSGLPVDAGIV